MNQGSFIEEAIKSVAEQDYPNIEHIVVDGGSIDQTLSILERHPQLRWISEPDAGQAAAINKGFRMATGQIYGWLNADDYYLPGAVAAAVEMITASGCALVHGGWRQIEADGRVIRDVRAEPFNYKRQLEDANAVCQPGAFFTCDAYWAVGGVDETYQYAMDYELWLKLGARFPVRHVDRIQAAYRYHPQSKSTSRYGAFVPETMRASRSHGGRLLSRLYLDYYLPHERPWAYRVLLAFRLLKKGQIRLLLRRIVRRGATDV